MADWDINHFRKLAGMAPLTESYDDDGDDGLSASERALANKADKDLRKKGVKVKDADPDKDMAALARRRKAAEAKREAAADADEADEAKSKAEEKAAAEKEATEAKAEAEKVETAATEKESTEKEATEAKRRGKAPNPESFNQHAKANAKDMTRAQFLKWAAETHGKGKAYASALFAKYNPKSGRTIKVDECFMLQHPTAKSFLLAENAAMNQYQWIDATSSLNPLIFETADEAKKMADWIYEWKNQTTQIIKIDMKDE